MIAITGNTFPVKDQLKALGGRWNAADRVWMVPQEKADEARKLVNGSAKTFVCDNGSTPYRPTKCKVCGTTARWNSRGFPIGDRILRSGECQSCYEERKMGY
jgi:hypothetical protein